MKKIKIFKEPVLPKDIRNEVLNLLSDEEIDYICFKTTDVVFKGSDALELGEDTYPTFGWAFPLRDMSPVTKSLRIGGDKREVIASLEKRGVLLEKHGNSSIAARNSYAIVDKRFSSVVKEHKVLLVYEEDTVSAPFRLQKVSYEIVTISFETFEKQRDLLFEIEKEISAQKSAEISETLGNAGCLEVGGNEKFSLNDIQKAGYHVLFSNRTKKTADHRSKTTHTYMCGFVKKGLQFAEIVIPNEFKGLAIGSKGANIKKFQKETGTKLKIK